MHVKIGKKYCGKVTGIQPYGVFVEIMDGVQGLVHISEVKQGYIENLNEIVKLGEKVNVIVLDVDEYTQKISLSMRVLVDEKKPKGKKKKRRYHPRFGNRKSKTGFSSIEKSMNGWIKDAIKYLKNYN